MMDDKLTLSIQQWVQTPPAERDVAQGAELLLKLNRNKYLYRNACLFPTRYDGIIEHELRKHLRIRLDGLTQREVVQMEHTVVPAAQESLDAGSPSVSTEADHPQEGTHIGRRADHDTLPEDIRSLYDRNGEVYFRMKEIFTTLQGMADRQACDRYELLVQLRDLDDEYRKNWDRYDHYDPSDKEQPVASDPDPMAAAKALSAARKFVSENLRKLATDAGNGEKAERMAAIQQRVDLILQSGGTFKPDFEAKLREADIAFPDAAS